MSLVLPQPESFLAQSSVRIPIWHRGHFMEWGPCPKWERTWWKERWNYSIFQIWPRWNIKQVRTPRSLDFQTDIELLPNPCNLRTVWMSKVSGIDTWHVLKRHLSWSRKAYSTALPGRVWCGQAGHERIIRVALSTYRSPASTLADSNSSRSQVGHGKMNV